jgi:hypothetical protein
MGSSVQRVEADIKKPASPIQSDDEYLAETKRSKEGLSVTSQKCLGVDPRILVTWDVEDHLWKAGFRLLGFRSSDGFAPDEHTETLSEHGQMILDEVANGNLVERLAEGTYFYTFVLRLRKYFGCFEWLTVVRFSETIPSARTAIGRIEDQRKLQQLQEDCTLHDVKSEIARKRASVELHKVNKELADFETPKREDSMDAQVKRDVEKLVRKVLTKAMTRIEIAMAVLDVKKRLKDNPGWKQLKKAEQEQLLADVITDMDADEKGFQDSV